MWSGYEKINPVKKTKVLVVESLPEMSISLHYTRKPYANFRTSVRCLGIHRMDSDLSWIFGW